MHAYFYSLHTLVREAFYRPGRFTYGGYVAFAVEVALHALSDEENQ